MALSVGEMTGWSIALLKELIHTHGEVHGISRPSAARLRDVDVYKTTRA